MKLTLRRTATTGPVRIEDEIYFEDDQPPMVHYFATDNKMDSYSLPPDELSGFIRPVISSQVEIRFPLIEKLCREIFSQDTTEDNK